MRSCILFRFVVLTTLIGSPWRLSSAYLGQWQGRPELEAENSPFFPFSWGAAIAARCALIMCSYLIIQFVKHHNKGALNTVWCAFDFEVNNFLESFTTSLLVSMASQILHFLLRGMKSCCLGAGCARLYKCIYLLR